MYSRKVHTSTPNIHRMANVVIDVTALGATAKHKRESHVDCWCALKVELRPDGDEKSWRCELFATVYVCARECAGEHEKWMNEDTMLAYGALQRLVLRLSMVLSRCLITHEIPNKISVRRPSSSCIYLAAATFRRWVTLVVRS